MDGSCHFGTLELITWPGLSAALGTRRGWGGVSEEEAADERRVFEGPKFRSNEAKYFKHRRSAFRWTCCGTVGDHVYGCLHHGHPEAKAPCSCDFCRGGKPLPEELYQENLRSQECQGIQIRRGPDPRSASFAGSSNLRMLRQSLMKDFIYYTT